jgi:hypothetical protein
MHDQVMVRFIYRILGGQILKRAGIHRFCSENVLVEFNCLTAISIEAEIRVNRWHVIRFLISNLLKIK